jgi:hypothetical protein
MSPGWVFTAVAALSISAGVMFAAGAASPTRVAIADLLAAEDLLEEPCSTKPSGASGER